MAGPLPVRRGDHSAEAEDGTAPADEGRPESKTEGGVTLRTTELNDVREVSPSAALRNASGKQPSAADRRANLIKVAAEKPVKRGRGRPMVMTPIETEAVRGIEAAMHLAHATAVNAGWYKDPKTGLPIERDLSFRAEKRLSAYARDARLVGRVVV